MELKHNLYKDILRLRRDVELIKHILMSEGELTNHAKKQLALARAQSEESYTSLQDL